MRPIYRPLLVCACALVGVPDLPAAGVPATTPVWRVEDLRRGMKGHGRTVLTGTKIEPFSVEILGVMKNTSPGRDLVLARLSGLGLEKTGVIAGMSGSPVYVEGKLVGAVAYAWAFGKEPIAGITPFAQMHTFVDTLERRDMTSSPTPVRVGLEESLRIEGRAFDSVTVAQTSDNSTRERDSLFLTPLRTPLAASGFTQHSLDLFTKRAGKFGLSPMTGGTTTSKIARDEKDVVLEAGGPLSVALMTGDFDMSGIGTVTHVEGGRVYGWGHPFMSLGACDLPMLTGYIHTIYPRQTVSFKMGSPLREVGSIHADVSTCVAGCLDKKADMLPVCMKVSQGKGETRTFKVRVARHRALLPTLVYTALTNSVDMEGELPDEMTAHLEARIELEGHSPVILKDTFSGFSGGRAPAALYTQIAAVVANLSFNSFKDLRIKSIHCSTHVEPGRSTADIDSVELDADTYCPGDTVKANVYLRPHKGPRGRVALSLKLPIDLPEGSYTALICDEPSSVRADVRGNPTLSLPTSAEQIIKGWQLLLSGRRTTLVMRLPIGAHGVAAGGKALPKLPGSMIHILGNSKRTGTMTMTQALVASAGTDWVILGADSVSFQVSKTRKVTRQDD